MSSLENKKCSACAGDITAITQQEANELLKELPQWQIINNHHLELNLRFKKFLKASEFLSQVAIIAEEENHHPDIFWSFTKIQINIWTHKINALTENDFILAAKISRLANQANL